MNIIFKKSPNFTAGRSGYSIKGICYHITGDSNYNQAVSWLCDPKSNASTHYVIEKNGEVFQLVQDADTAWGQGIINAPSAKIYFDNGSKNPNNYLISIEVVSKGEIPTVEQWQALTELTVLLVTKYHIPITYYNLIGHNQLNAVDRKFDPVTSYTVEQVIDRAEFEMGINLLVDKGIVSSPDYWRTFAVNGAICRGDYVRGLIKNISDLYN